MSKDNDQKYEDGMELVGTTKEGFGLFRREEPHGGYSYWTDEVPIGVLVYDEGLTNLVSLFDALEHLGEGERWWKHIGEVFSFKQD